VLTFSIPGISIGGHLGGLVGGALAALVISGAERYSGRRTSIALEALGIAAISVASIAGALLAAGPGSGLA